MNPISKSIADFLNLENPDQPQRVKALKQMIWEMTNRDESQINRKSQFAKILLDISSSINEEKEFSSDEYIVTISQRDPEFFSVLFEKTKTMYLERE